MEGQVMFSKKKKKASEIASVTSDEAHQPTVISNADVANILKGDHQPYTQEILLLNLKCEQHHYNY